MSIPRKVVAAVLARDNGRCVIAGPHCTERVSNIHSKLAAAIIETTPKKLTTVLRGLTLNQGLVDRRAAMQSTQSCEVAGCERPYRAKGLCNMHWQRRAKSGSTADPVPRPTECSVPDCQTKPFGRGFCLKHYARWYRHGSPLHVDREYRQSRGECTADGCSNIDSGPHGYCQKHHTRITRHGDALFVGKPKVRIGEENSSWTGVNASYAAVHQRLRVQRGSARNYTCTDCNGTALHWSYDHADKNSKESEYGLYSCDLSHYVPRCVRCHKRFDMEFTAVEK